MYTVVNEFEECRLQALTLTKSLNFVEGCYKDLAIGLQAHGHNPTELMYTDNAQAELAFHERTQSLQENVSHIVINPYDHLPLLLHPAEHHFVCYDAADLIDSACSGLLSGIEQSGDKLVVGLAICYTEQCNTGPQSGGIDLIQISTGDTVYLFKV